MDWDEPEPNKTTGIVVGDDLTNLSLEELHARIKALGNEIGRINDEVERKKSTQSAANDIFKS